MYYSYYLEWSYILLTMICMPRLPRALHASCSHELRRTVVLRAVISPSADSSGSKPQVMGYNYLIPGWGESE
jgi:hypothetical protein